MGSRRHNLIVFTLVASSGLCFYASGVFSANSRYSYSILLVIIGLIFISVLYKIYNRSNRNVAFFFDALRNDDTTLSFPENTDVRSVNLLYQSMNKLNHHIQKIKLQNEYKEKYYRALIQQSSTGLVAINNKNEIELINEMTCNYAGISALSTNMKQLQMKNEGFYKILCNIKPGNTVTYKSIREDSVKLLLFRASQILSGENNVKLVSIEDIKHELDEKELESYQKLISILIHEIMNSIAPLTSLSNTLIRFFINNDNTISTSEIDQAVVDSTVKGLKVIEEQGNGLLNFVSNYRKLTKIPQPVFKPFNVEEWIGQIRILFNEKMTLNSIQFEIDADLHSKEIIADKNLINQVVTNLLNNAIEACAEKESNKSIKIHISKNRENRVIIKVFNNGPYISPELQEKIFIPFFTTKEKGSGIGLSLSRQIMKLHKGSINVVSDKNNGTVFILEV